jgi:iron complex outermembrane receptor protein
VEQTSTVNAGVDYGLFNRITGSVDLYQRNTKIYYYLPQNPSFFGFSNFDNYNVGLIENKGIEIAAEVVPVRTDNLEWRIGGNVTFKILKLQS